MNRVLLALAALSGLAACAYRPTATEVLRIVDSPADVRACARLSSVSDPILTGPGFGEALEAMLEYAVALGATDLYLEKRSRDWALVRGVAYRCGPEVRVRAVRTVTVRTKG
jgi:hypothetical protein